MAASLSALNSGVDCVQEVDLGPRHHHLAQLLVVGGEDLLEQLALLVVELGVPGHELAQLELTHLLAGRLRVTTGEPDDHVGRRRQQPDQRRGDAWR